jgi:hypothetical protein
VRRQAGRVRNCDSPGLSFGYAIIAVSLLKVSWRDAGEIGYGDFGLGSAIDPVKNAFVIFTCSACRDSDPLPSFLDRAFDIFLLSFAIAFERKITRSKSVTGFAFWDAVSQSVDGIGEIYARLIPAVDRPREEVQDTFECHGLGRFTEQGDCLLVP